MEADDSDPPANPPGAGSASASASATPTPSASGPGPIRLRRKPIPRKGHTKSRRGCLQCKRRRVKCPETLPECCNCTRIGLVCEYPSTRTSPASWLAAISSPSAPLQSTPTMFTADDMRFFHHFLLHAYPPLPILGDDIWRGVATLSHSYDYLMHAMLGLAAGHLDLHGANCSSQALSHRVKAIRALNTALTNPPASTAEADARFAALFALVFQASCMPDGMTEFLAMTKGCHIIYHTSMLTMDDSLFGSFARESYADSVGRLIGAPPLVLDAEQELMIRRFLRSLRALGPLCKSPLEVRFLAATERIARTAAISAARAFAEITDQYRLLNHATTEDFAPFVDPRNHAVQLLLIHFVLIEFAIGYMCLGSAGSRFAFRRRTCTAWTNQLAAGLPAKYRKYAEWPMDFVRKLDELVPG